MVVQFSADSSIQVDGELIGLGTAANHIQLGGASGNYASLKVNGTLNLSYTDISGLIVPNSGASSLLFADCSFKGGGFFTFIGYMFETLSYVQLDRCNTVQLRALISTPTTI